MKITILVARILLGLFFYASGLVSILNLGKMGGMPADTTTFLTEPGQKQASESVKENG